MTTTLEIVADPSRQTYLIPIAILEESPLNKRRHWGAMAELAENVKLHGVQQPGLVRAVEDGRYELVFGHRRFRAARDAGFETFPAQVRVVDDDEVLELQVIENCQRHDVHFLEEADWYQALHQTKGLTADEIAARVGKSRRLVYQRLQIAKLPEAIRQLCFDGKIDASKALALAGLRNPEHRIEAASWIAKGRWDGNPHTLKEVTEHIENRYMLQLKDAPFEPNDATLLPKAGACTTCQKRTGAQPELFEGVESADVCTDPDCFGEKKAALVQLDLQKAKEAGAKVLSKKEAKKVFTNDWSSSPAEGSGYVELDDRYEKDPQRRTYRQLLGKDFVAPVVAPAPGHTAQIAELIPEKEVAKLIKAAGVDLKPKPAPERVVSAEERALDAATKAAFASREGVGTNLAFELLVAEISDRYALPEIRKAEGVKGTKASDFEKLPNGVLPRFALKVLANKLLEDSYGEPVAELVAVWKELGVDYEALLKAEKAKDAAAKKDEPKPAKKKASAKK